MNGLKRSKIVSVDKIKSDKASPILATFQNDLLSNEKLKQVVCKRVETESDGRKYALIATNSDVYKADITNNSVYEDTYLAIHNKETGEINLVQVQKAEFSHILYDNKRTAFEKNIVDSRKVLMKEFGGKKAMKLYDKNQNQQMNSSILDDAVDKMLDNVDVDKILEENTQHKAEQNTGDSLSIFPEIKGDVSNKSVNEVFTLEVLLGDDIIEHLFEISIETLQSDLKKSKFMNSYNQKTAESIQLSKNPESADNLRKMSSVIYAEMLLILISFRKKSFVPSKELSKFSPRLQQHIKSNFFIKGSNECSNLTRQKAIIFYTILMLLTTKKMAIEFDNLLNGINLSKRELIKYTSVIGCTAKDNILSLKKVAKLDDNSNFKVKAFKGKKSR